MMAVQARSDRLLKALNDVQHIYVVMHDNPDPDAIASGWAIAHLAKEKLQRTAKVVGGGAIVRAENMAMVGYLKPPISLVDALTPAADSGAVLVDCSPEASNHLLAGSNLPSMAVIDHHEQKTKRAKVRFRDIRKNACATAVIATSYLLEQEISIPTELATALLYAIRTETRAAHCEFSSLDKRAISALTPLVDHGVLSDIENAPLARNYYEDLLFALQNTFIYEDTALCFLPTATGPETVGEYADLLVRCKGVKKVLCGAVVDRAILFSARTRKTGGDATELLRRTLKDLGHCGGHAHRAGGKIPLQEDKTRISDETQSTLRLRWLQACGLPEMRGTRLVAKRDILENL